MILNDLVINKGGLVRGPFGSALKKSIFVKKGKDTYKVYEQGNVLSNDFSIGNYYISKEYYDSGMYRYEIKEDDLLVSCSGVNYGTIVKVPHSFENGIINQALLRIRVNKKIVNVDYFKYLFENLISNIITTGSGDSTIPNFPPLKSIKKIEVSIPSLPEQEKIVEYLNRYKDKIDNNNCIIDILNKKVMLIYSRWFEQFEFPYNNSTYATSGGIIEIDKKTNLKKPNTWTISNLLDSELVSKIKPGIHEFKNRKIYLSTSEVDNNDYNTFVNSITYFDRESRADMEPIEYSVWFAKMKKSIKHIAFERDSKLLDKVILSTGFFGLQCTEDSFEYIYCIINSEWFEKAKDCIASGSTQQSITDLTINYIPIIVPPSDVLKKFSSLVKKDVELLYKLKYENDILKSYLDFSSSLALDKKIKCI